MIKLKSKESCNDIPVSFKRYLYFNNKEKLTTLTLFRRLLMYFHFVMYKNSKQISVNEYLKRYLSPEHLPFKIYLMTNPKIQITLDDSITLESKAQVFVLFENEEDFDTRLLSEALPINKDKMDDHLYHEKASKGTKISINDCFE